jgi:FKBP-type peptidyl-prolyl cis-trans isomerase
MENKTELVITDIVEGTGLTAEKGALIFCHYTGTLEDGTKFDSSYDHGKPFETVLSLKKVIQGWYLGIMGMKVGGKRKLFIPSHLGYGDQKKSKIPPNSNLLFEVELLEVRLRD